MAKEKNVPGKTSPVMAAIVVLLLTLIGAGTGFSVGSMLGSPQPAPGINAQTAGHTQPDAAKEAHGSETAPMAAEPLQAADEPAEMTIVAFPPILTNLAEPKETWVRLEGSLLMKTETDVAHDLLAERADENLVTFLRTVKLKDIEGPSGFLHFREDLNDLVSQLSEGQVKEVIIHSMVLE
jgi:flagellar protein FliL